MAENKSAAVNINQNAGGEFERTPVPNSKLKGWKSFLGMYAGEHAAGTEFMIGPLFLAAGASLKDLTFGLLIGNILAILTWRYLVAPIAVSSKLTLYYQLEKIAGKHLVKVYNVVNGLLFCFLAGAMITVSASAVGIPFDISFSVPENILGLSSPAFSLIVIIVGVVMTIVAAAGYNTVSKFANIAAPWMIVVFAACGLSALSQMEVDSLDSLLIEWDKGVSVVQSINGKVDFGFWKIVIFSWLCNAAMHFGMADLSIMRFAKDSRAGWGPSIGMFLGHYMAWICASFMLAAQIKLTGDISANPGALAWSAVGWTGIICVIVAGWTTANPTIYRAGLAFQSLFPSNAKSYSGVILAGLVATAAGIFPALSAKLLDFVGLYGTILGPMGGVIFVNHYLAKKMNFTQDYADKKESGFNMAVLLAWVLPVALGLYFIFGDQKLFAAYAVIPCWIASSLLYVIIMKLQKS
jgi:NCS1 family nucleobase:cation symporter-1